VCPAWWDSHRPPPLYRAHRLGDVTAQDAGIFLHRPALAVVPAAPLLAAGGMSPASGVALPPRRRGRSPTPVAPRPPAAADGGTAVLTLAEDAVPGAPLPPHPTSSAGRPAPQHPPPPPGVRPERVERLRRSISRDVREVVEVMLHTSAASAASAVAAAASAAAASAQPWYHSPVAVRDALGPAQGSTEARASTQLEGTAPMPAGAASHLASQPLPAAPVPPAPVVVAQEATAAPVAAASVAAASTLAAPTTAAEAPPPHAPPDFAPPTTEQLSADAAAQHTATDWGDSARRRLSDGGLSVLTESAGMGTAEEEHRRDAGEESLAGGHALSD
jgi:hypothetical protein